MKFCAMKLFDSQMRQQSFMFSKPTQHAIQCEWGLFPWVNQLSHEADHSPQSSAEVKNEQSCNFIPQYASMVCTGINLLLCVILQCKGSITEVNGSSSDNPDMWLVLCQIISLSAAGHCAIYSLCLWQRGL